MDISGIVTIRFQRLSDSSKSNADGFLLPYGCAGADQETTCKQRPVLLLTSNIQQSAACTDHIAPVLNSLIDGILRSRNGERHHGFLRRPELPQPLPKSSSLRATEEVVWQSRLDGRYDVIVFRSTKAYAGVLVVRDGRVEIFRSDVALTYDAAVGPDVTDIQAWMDTAIAAVDSSKPVQQVMAEAVRRTEAERQSRIARLHTSKNADKAYLLTIAVYRSAESAVDWLLTANVLLDGRSPVELLDEPQGIARIKTALDTVLKTVYPLS